MQIFKLTFFCLVFFTTGVIIGNYLLKVDFSSKINEKKIVTNMKKNKINKGSSKMLYDVIIIGSGPAGLTSAIYSSRAQLKTIVFEGSNPGGQLMTTTAVENWPGEISIQGPDLMMKMQEHAKHCGAELLQEEISSVDFSKTPFKLTTQGGKVFESKVVIVATGAKSRKLECPGEKEYFAQGVSTCATCDGLFYQGKNVVVVGGGNSSMVEAEHLLHIVNSITLIQRSESITAHDPIKFKVMEHPNVKIIYNSIVKEIKGNGSHVTSIVIKNSKENREEEIKTDGVFVSIGYKPNTDIFKGHLEIGQGGYIKVDGITKTSVEGVFAAGDVSDYLYKQAITSSGVGCMAALDAQRYLSKKDLKK